MQGEVVPSSVTLMWFVCVNFLLGFSMNCNCGVTVKSKTEKSGQVFLEEM